MSKVNLDLRTIGPVRSYPMTHLHRSNELTAILTRLNSRKPAVQEHALREVGAMPPEDVARLYRLETDRYRHRSSQNATIQKVSLLVFLLQGVCSWTTFAWPGSAAAAILHIHVGVEIGTLILSCTGMLFPLLVPQRARRHVAALLAQTEDVRLLNEVVSLATDNNADKAVSSQGRQALKRLLRKWRADKDAPFTSAQLHALLLPLRSPYDDPDLTLAILSILGQAGDEQVLPLVRQLAEDGAATEKMRTIKQAAQESLLQLQQNLREQNQASSLLRAATSVSSVESANLVRAAQPAVSNTAPNEMLRVVEPAEAPLPAAVMHQSGMPADEVVIRTMQIGRDLDR